MSKVKAAGVTKNGRDSNPKYLGVKVNHGEQAIKGSILVRQRGTTVVPGKNVAIGKDHTLYSLINGVVSFATKRKKHFDSKVMLKKVVNVQ